MLYTMCVCIRCRRSRVYSNAFKCIIFTAQLQTNGIIFRFVYNNLQNMLASISVKRTSNNSTTKYNDTHLKKEFDRETDNTTDKLTHAHRADTLYSLPKYTSRNQCTYSLWRVVCINFPRRKTLWLMWKMHLKCIKCCIQMLTKCNFFFFTLIPPFPFVHHLSRFVYIFSVLLVVIVAQAHIKHGWNIFTSPFFSEKEKLKMTCWW